MPRSVERYGILKRHDGNDFPQFVHYLDRPTQRNSPQFRFFADQVSGDTDRSEASGFQVGKLDAFVIVKMFPSETKFIR